jgi:hypothetical protein
MAKCYVKAFFDWIEQTEALEDDERGRLFVAILEYARSGIAPDLAGRESILFPVFKSQVDRDLENSTAYAENGKKGGKTKNLSQTEPKLTKPNQSEPKRPNKEKEEDKEKDNDKDEEITAASPPTRAKSSDFDLFWQAYPKKVGKEAARKAFSRVKAPLESLLTAIERQKCGNQWTKENGRFIPNPATWLNQGRWEDEVAQTPLGRAAKPGYGVQGHHDELNPLERAAVDRVMGPVSKGAARLQQGVQRYGDELDAFQLEAVERMLAENKEDKEDKT